MRFIGSRAVRNSTLAVESDLKLTSTKHSVKRSSERARAIECARVLGSLARSTGSAGEGLSCAAAICAAERASRFASVSCKRFGRRFEKVAFVTRGGVTALIAGVDTDRVSLDTVRVSLDDVQIGTWLLACDEPVASELKIESRCVCARCGASSLGLALWTTGVDCRPTSRQLSRPGNSLCSRSPSQQDRFRCRLPAPPEHEALAHVTEHVVLASCETELPLLRPATSVGGAATHLDDAACNAERSPRFTAGAIGTVQCFWCHGVHVLSWQLVTILDGAAWSGVEREYCATGGNASAVGSCEPSL